MALFLEIFVSISKRFVSHYKEVSEHKKYTVRQIYFQLILILSGSNLFASTNAHNCLGATLGR